MAFTYAPGRSGKHAADILKGFDGILQVAGYTGYNRLIVPKRQANVCWAYARRKLFERTKNSAAPIAQEGLRQITAVYRVETRIRSLPASQRLAVRQD
ncbi:transposase [Salipiger sp. 1_MG-2023]|uniref:IS66 family transposase n=1 Tax=Salipiger sp. 1_MG-2023 TaxID=3062665 RepID=UPI0026E1DA00|nr:transposase [Salipiger sp. 1_MG-2023]MDO6587964.1 transposase [Salipiger sp. 1_MG-2023]